MLIVWHPKAISLDKVSECQTLVNKQVLFTVSKLELEIESQNSLAF